MISVGDLFAQQKTLQIDWNIAGELPSTDVGSHIGVAGPVAGIHNGVMFVGGGANFPEKLPWEGGSKKYHNKVHVFTKAGNKLTPLSIDLFLPEHIAYSANCSTPKGLVYAGGENEKGISDKVYMIKWDALTQMASLVSLPSLPIPLTNAAAVQVEHMVFVVGGETKEGVSNKLWSIDLNQNGSVWKELSSLPVPVSHTVFVSTEKHLYVLGGRMKTKEGISKLYNSVFEYDIFHNKWKALPSLPYALSAGTGVSIGKKGVVLFGGDKGTTFNKVEKYLVDINAEVDEAKKAALIKQKNSLQTEHPGFSKEILYYTISTGKSISIGELPYPTPVTTSAFWWDDQVIIPSGEIKAGIRTPKILIGKM